jgi:hypothetical protein
MFGTRTTRSGQCFHQRLLVALSLSVLGMRGAPDHWTLCKRSQIGSAAERSPSRYSRLRPLCPLGPAQRGGWPAPCDGAWDSASHEARSSRRRCRLRHHSSCQCRIAGDRVSRAKVGVGRSPASVADLGCAGKVVTILVPKRSRPAACTDAHTSVYTHRRRYTWIYR